MRILGLLLSFAHALACVTAQAATLDAIKQRGTVNCGTAPNLPGFAYTDDKNVRCGFDVDLCRALAAAVLGDADKVQLSPLNLRDGFATLTTGGVDVLTHRLTWTYNLIGLVEFLAVLQIAFPAWLIGDQLRSTGYLFACSASAVALQRAARPADADGMTAISARRCGQR
jgi:hypothetical protein